MFGLGTKAYSVELPSDEFIYPTMKDRDHVTLPIG